MKEERERRTIRVEKLRNLVLLLGVGLPVEHVEDRVEVGLVDIVVLRELRKKRARGASAQLSEIEKKRGTRDRSSPASDHRSIRRTRVQQRSL